MRNTLAVAAFGICLASWLTGCGPKPEAPTSPDTATASPERTAPSEPTTAAPGGPVTPATEKKLTVGVMPKLVGIEYFNATERGAREAAAELGVDLLYNGPVTNDVTLQSQMIDTWVAQRVDAIAVAPNDPGAISPALTKARKRAIKTLTWDADAEAASRDFFVNQATSESVARAMMDVMAEGAGEDAKYIIITGSLTAANQNIWMAEMEKYRLERYPNMIDLGKGQPKASEEDAALATQVTLDVLKAYPEVNGIFAITSVALPGAAEALRKSNSADKVFLTGLATPNVMKPYVQDGTVKKFVMWNAVDLGYLTVHVAVGALRGDLQPGATSFSAGRLGDVAVHGDQVVLGPALVFDATNIGQYDF